MAVMNADAYLSQLQALLPTGMAWPREPDAVLTQLLGALAEEFARVDGRGQTLRDEADPNATLELLPDWERVTGLPDPCVGEEQTLQARRNALLGRLAGLGGQSRQYFIDLAAALGYTVGITEFRPFQVGDAVGDAVFGDGWRFVWRVDAPTSTVTDFRVDQSSAGEALREWGNDRLECVLSRERPAQTKLLFGYGG